MRKITPTMMNRSSFQIVTALTIITFSSVSAYGAGSGLPWEAPLQSILESITGPVARIIAVMVITLTGLTLAFGETSGGMRRLIQIVFGLSIAFAAASFFLSFFSFAGGAVVSSGAMVSSGAIV